MMEPTPRPSQRPSVSGRAKLTIDLSNLPPLVPPTPPSNTLLFTNLNTPALFEPDALETIRNRISKTAPIHAFAPLKSFRRIVISFFDVDTAISVRQAWNGEAVLGERIRVYFGQPTPVQAKDEHLALPAADDLVSISPPPSPPLSCDWETGPETVYSDALADALSRLNRGLDGFDSPREPGESGSLPGSRPRRSSSIVIYSPVDSGFSPDLPAVLLEDMTGEPVASPGSHGSAAY